MHLQSDYGYSTGLSCCIACHSPELNCCNGDGKRYSHRIFNEDGQFISGHHSEQEGLTALSAVRLDREMAHNFYFLVSR